MLFENQRRHIRKLTHTIDDGEIEGRIVFCHRFDDWCLREPDANDQIVTALGESAHCRLDRSRIAGLHVPQNDWKVLRSPPNTFPGGSVEGMIVLTPDIEDNANVNFGPVV